MEIRKVVFIGTPEFGAVILEKLISSGLKPVLAITNPDEPVGRKQAMTPPPVKIIAQKYNLNIIQPSKIKNSKLEIKNFQPDLAVVAAYGQIIPKEILEIPKYGCLNVHPSLLPKYRGASPIQSAILNGDEKTGVTIMLMDKEMDHGPIIAQEEFRILNLDFQKLHGKLAELGANLLIETIPKWLKGEIKAKEQDHSKATFTKILKKEDGEIDWSKSPEEIERKIRALNPWPGTFTFVKKNDKLLRVKILGAELKDKKLTIKKVQPEGKKEMDYKEYLLSYPKIC